MKEYIIDGRKFKNPKSFYGYVEKIFTSDLSWQTGRNLDAFEDILQGGFGEHAFEESIKVIWINMAKSKEVLPPKFYETVIEIIDDAENVVFEKFDYNR